MAWGPSCKKTYPMILICLKRKWRLAIIWSINIIQQLSFQLWNQFSLPKIVRWNFIRIVFLIAANLGLQTWFLGIFRLKFRCLITKAITQWSIRWSLQVTNPWQLGGRTVISRLICILWKSHSRVPFSCIKGRNWWSDTTHSGTGRTTLPETMFLWLFLHFWWLNPNTHVKRLLLITWELGIPLWIPSMCSVFFSTVIG